MTPDRFERDVTWRALGNRLIIDDRPVALLWGAGCSVQAGIPLAGGVIGEIERHYPTAYNRARGKAQADSLSRVPSYAEVMAELTVGERRELIRKLVSSGRINWSHLLLAEFIRRNYIKRVFTTNFDPLILRACALLDVNIATYDLAASPSYVDDAVVDPAVFYLHGQHHGFFQANTGPEAQAQADAATSLFKCAHRYLWIVIGYSGVNDALFHTFVGSGDFNPGLYWCHLKGHLPTAALDELNRKGAFGVEIDGADQLMLQLACHIDCFPPSLIDQPFGHLNSLVANMGPLPLFSTKGDMKTFAEEMLEEGVRTIQDTKVWKSIREVLRERDPFRVPELARAALSTANKKPPLSANGRLSSIRPLLAWACIKAADRLLEDAQAYIEGQQNAPPDADPKLPNRARTELQRFRHQFQKSCNTAKEINPADAKLYNQLLRQPFPTLKPTRAARRVAATN